MPRKRNPDNPERPRCPACSIQKRKLEPDGRCWACNYRDDAQRAEALAGIVRYERGTCSACKGYKAIQESGMCWACQSEAREDEWIGHTGWAYRECPSCRNWSAKGCVLEAYRACKPEIEGVYYVALEKV